MNDFDNKMIEKLEELNKEYLESGYYEFGKYMKTIFNLLKKGKIFNIILLYFIHFKNKKNKKLINNSVMKFNNSKSYVINNNFDKKIVIYTCITGNYDKVEEPLIKEMDCDYIIFTNNKNLKSANWQIKSIPEEIQGLKDNARINRYIKMHPHELFPEYDYSIYIDGNIKIISVISKFIRKIKKTTGLAIHKHCVNNCIFEEVKSCRAYGKGNYNRLKKQINRYEKQGFPKNYGLLECNVLVVELKNKQSQKIFESWWEEYFNSESLRDQIALPYVLWKNNYKIDDVGCLGQNVNRNPAIKINMHI